MPDEIIISLDKNQVNLEFNNFRHRSCEIEEAKLFLLLGVLGVEATVSKSQTKTVTETEIQPESLKEGEKS